MVCSLAAVGKHWPKAPWAMKGLAWLIGYRPSPRETKEELKARRRTEIETEGDQGFCLSSQSYSGTFLMEPRPACPGMTLHTVEWALLCQLASKNTTHRHAYSSLMKTMVLFSQMCLDLCQADETNQHSQWVLMSAEIHLFFTSSSQWK